MTALKVGTYGNIRANYVNAAKRFKTTELTKDASEVKRLLVAICGVIDDPFVENNLSITTGMLRQSTIKWYKPLVGVGINNV